MGFTVMARPTSADVRAHVRNVHDETLAWQRQQGLSQIPSQHSHDQEEANLGKRLAKLLIRRTKALGTRPSGSILTQAEATLINSLQGVPSQGCASSRYKIAATPAQEHESSLAQRFYRYKGNLSSAQIKELEAIWLSKKKPAIEGPRHAPANCVGGAESQNLLPCSVGIHHALTQRTLTSSIAKNFWRDSKNTWTL